MLQPNALGFLFHQQVLHVKFQTVKSDWLVAFVLCRVCGLEMAIFFMCCIVIMLNDMKK